ncbi:hypothetical protein [Plastoroseomonas hellenica]|uniref:hypothetical protein n=1 Tax=Plastoroseomonas hellenica TaxID=2687306 RepID=UPI001BA57AB7|nr:hypothetical protein [Plastoroseomonas hellenica]MBR0641953.1 hypothetical protein [Plastoroseomonas hellenica]
MRARPVSAARRIGIGAAAMLAAAVFAHAVRLAVPGEALALVLLFASWLVLGALATTAFEGGLVAGLLGLSGLLVLPLVMGFAVDVPLLGRRATLPVAEAPAARLTTRFRFTDARPRPALARVATIPIHGRYRQSSFAYVIAPVLPAGWRAGDPVPAWVIAEGHAPAAAWSEPGGQFIRALPKGDHAAAFWQVTGGGHLPDGTRPIVGRWVAEERDPVGEAWARLGLALAGGLLGWSAAVGLSGRSERPAPDGRG